MKNFSKLLVSLIGAFSVATASAADIVNLLSSETGMQRVTYEYLRDQGADLAGIQHRSFALTMNDSDSTPVEIFVKGQDKSEGRTNQFGPGGYIDFYAQANESIYTNQVAYTLSVGGPSADRKRMAKVKPKFNKAAPSSTVYEHTQVVEENNVYDSLAPSFKDPWHYGFTISIRPTPKYSFTLDNVANGSAPAKVEVEMFGLLDYAFEGNDHHYEVLINDVKIGEDEFDGVQISTVSAENVTVNEGANTVEYNYLPLVVAAFDRVTLNEVTLSYPRNTVAVEGRLSGYFDADQAVVTNLGNSKAQVYRKLANGKVERILGTQLIDGGTGFATGGVAADYLIVSESMNAFHTPEIAAIADTQDIKSGPAEYLVIAHDSLMGTSMDELVQIRQQDYSVKVVDVRQVYSQFGAGVLSADAIQSYVQYAVANMQTRFVVLVGSDTFDYNNYQFDAISMVPTKYVTTPGGEVTVHHAPSDASYADIDSDGVQDVAIGRISARTEAEFSSVVEKIRDYQAREGYAGRVLIGADKEDVGNGVSFLNDAEAMIAAMPADWGGSVRESYRAFPDIDGDLAAHDKLIAAINAGVSVVSYIGHSSPQSWAYTSPPLLQASEISSFENLNKPHIAVHWGCWNTYFVDPRGNSMADQFLLAGEMGAVAVLGATALTTSTEERAYGLLLNAHLYDEGMTIGEAVVRAKQDLSQSEDNSLAIQYGYNIIGDPAMVINH